MHQRLQLFPPRRVSFHYSPENRPITAPHQTVSQPPQTHLALHSPTAEEEQNERSIALMRQIGAGDAKAFRLLVELHQQRVVGTAFRILGNLEDAHDAAQQVFLRIWKSAPRYEPTARFTTWLYTIVKNLTANEIRRRQAKPVTSLDTAAEEHFFQVADDSQPNPHEQLQQAELEKSVNEAIATLPEPQRLAVTLRAHQDLAYEEIAEILATSVSAVKSLLFRARSALREKLADRELS